MARHNTDGKDTDYEPDDDLPMTEEQWEQSMRESDARSARFGELLETLMDHPNRDELVAREMGWDDFADAIAEDRASGRDDDDTNAAALSDASPSPQASSTDDEDNDDDDESDDDDPEGLPDWLGADGADDDDDQDEGDDADDPIRRRSRERAAQVPAYGLAMEVAMMVHNALDPWMKRPADQEIDERIPEAAINAQIAAAKLAGGHGMGYDDHALCGNIVCCKRGLEGARTSFARLTELRDEHVLPADVVDPLLPELQKVIDAIDERIADLRSRVWWDKK